MKSSLLFIATLLVVLFAVTANCKLDDLLNAYARIEKLKRDLRNRHSLADSQLPSYCSVALYNACPANSLCTCTRVNECGVCTSNTCGCGSSLIGALEDVESDKFFKKLGKLFKKALPYLKAGVKEYVNNNFDEEADFKFGKLLKKIGKVGLKLGKAYLRTQGIPLEDEQADKFFKNLWKVVKQVGKGAIKSYINQNFDEEADFKLGKLLKKVGKIGLKLGKAYLRTQGIPLSDLARPVTFPRKIICRKPGLIRRRPEVESDKFFKKLGKLFKKALPYLKAGVKEYVNNNLADTQAWTPGQIAANFARGQIGRCYSQAQRYGNPCFDCSGLVLKSWAAAGRSVPTYTGAYPGGLREVSVNAMQEGDIVFRPGHVGIYVGGGQIVSAENSKNGVRMRDVNTYKKWFGITKVFRP